MYHVLKRDHPYGTTSLWVFWFRREGFEPEGKFLEWALNLLMHVTGGDNRPVSPTHPPRLDRTRNCLHRTTILQGDLEATFTQSRDANVREWIVFYVRDFISFYASPPAHYVQ